MKTVSLVTWSWAIVHRLSHHNSRTHWQCGRGQRHAGSIGSCSIPLASQQCSVAQTQWIGASFEWPRLPLLLIYPVIRLQARTAFKSNAVISNPIQSNPRLFQTTRSITHTTATVIQEAQLMLTTGSTRLAVSRGQQTWYHSTCYI